MTTTITTTVAKQIHECLRFLANGCDFANTKDGAGFSAIDAYVGHSLASALSLSPAQVAIGAKIVRKYRKQLEQGGCTIPSPDEVAAYVAAPPVASTREAELKECSVYLYKQRICVEYPYAMLRQIKPALDPFKAGPQKIEDWAFNSFGRNEWSYPVSSSDKILDALRPFADLFSIAPQIATQRELERERIALESLQRQEEIKAALISVQPYLDGEPLPGGRVLFAHQREAVKQCVVGQCMILAHDMGLGKSSTALVAAKAYDCAVIVVCPASLKINWLREAEQAGVAIEVWSWAKMPEAPDCNYVLVADEAHYAQAGEKTVRGKAFLALAEQARAVFCLTGTPLKNGRPINLYPLLKACKSPVADNLRDYEKRYCAARNKNVGSKTVWDVTGASHLDELYRKTTGATILYKKKKECLDLPTKTRVFREIEVSASVRKEYLGTIERLREESKARIEASKAEQEALIEAAKETGEDIDEKDPDNARALVELGILRHAGSLAKVESAIEVAQEVLEQGESIVIFTAYLETLRRIAEALPGCETITGGQTTEQRQAAIDRFQAKESRVIISMIAAGGVGITLTAASTVLLVDRPWTPGDAIQAEDRCHRIGQTENVTAIWLQYEELDAKIDALLQEKQERIELVLSGKRKTMRGIKSVAAMAKSILTAIKKRKPLPVEEDDEIIEAPMQAVEVPVIVEPEESEEHTHAFSEDRDSAVEVVEVAAIVESVALVAEAPKKKKDGRLKGQTRRVRKNVMLDAAVVEFLESMKVPSQATTVEGGYSAFIERLVRESPEFKAHALKNEA